MRRGERPFIRELKMKTLTLLFSILLCGCAVMPSNRDVSNDIIPDGVWIGDLNFQTIKADGSKTDQGPAEVMIASCNGYIQVWDGNRDGTYTMIGKHYVSASVPDSHIAYFTDKDSDEPGWSEIQSYVLLELNTSTARLQWSRAVNNRDLAIDDVNRYFFSHGIGTLERISDKCNEELVPN